MPFRCLDRQRVQKFSSPSLLRRIPLSSTFYSTRPPRQSNIRQSKCYLLLSTQHRLSTFPSLPRTFNPSSRIIIRFCSRTPPLWNLLPRSTLLLYFSFYLISLQIDETLENTICNFLHDHSISSISPILWNKATNLQVSKFKYLFILRNTCNILILRFDFLLFHSYYNPQFSLTQFKI